MGRSKHRGCTRITDHLVLYAIISYKTPHSMSLAELNIGEPGQLSRHELYTLSPFFFEFIQLAEAARKKNNPNGAHNVELTLCRILDKFDQSDLISEYLPTFSQDPKDNLQYDPIVMKNHDGTKHPVEIFVANWILDEAGKKANTGHTKDADQLLDVVKDLVRSTGLIKDPGIQDHYRQVNAIIRPWPPKLPDGAAPRLNKLSTLIHGFSDILFPLPIPIGRRWLEARAQTLLERSDIRTWLKPEDTILDIGTGKGHMMAALKGSVYSIFGIDIWDFPTRSVAKQLEGTHFVTAKGQQLPFRNDSVDGVMFWFVLHHVDTVDDQVTALQEAVRVCKPGGHIFLIEDIVASEEEKKLTIAADRRLNVELSGDEPHNYRSEQGWRATFEGLGLSVVDYKPFTLGTKVQHGMFVVEVIK